MPTANLKTRINANLVLPELSYRIMGIIFNVYNKLSYGFQEKYYQRAIEVELKNSGVNYKREAQFPIKYGNQIIGRYFVDFIIDDKIAIELKVGKEFYPRDWKQLASYLKFTKLPLGILILISQDGIKYRRIANTLN